MISSNAKNALTRLMLKQTIRKCGMDASKQDYDISEPKTPADLLTNPILIIGSPLSPHLRSFNIRGAFIVWLRKHAHDANKNLLNALNRAPSFRRVLVVVWIVARRMEDRYTNVAV